MSVSKRIIPLLEYGQFPWLFVEFTNRRCISVWHNNLPISIASWGFLKCLINCAIMLILQNSSLISIVECILEIFWNLLFTEFLFNSVDDCHYSFDVSIEHVSFLQTLEWDCLVDRHLWLFLVDCSRYLSSRLVLDVYLLLIQWDNIPLLRR